MTTQTFTDTVIPQQYVYVQYSGTLEEFETELRAAFLGDTQVFANKNDATIAIAVHNGIACMASPTDWASFDGQWTVMPDSDMQGTQNGGYTPVDTTS